MRRVVCIAFSALILLTLFGATLSQSSDTDFLDQKIDINLEHATLLQTLSTLSVKYRVPIGLERDAKYWQRVRNLMSFEAGQIKWKESSIQIKSGTLKQILDSLVSQEPIYSWEVKDGVINVYPVQSRDPVLQKLLDTTVETFALEQGMNKVEIHKAILDLPAIKAWLEAEKLEARTPSNFTGSSIYKDDKLKLDISHTNVRGVLNRVIKDSEFKLWVVDRIGDKRESLEISF